MMPASACGATSAGSTPSGSADQRALVDEHVLGEAAVARQPGELVPLAVDVEPAAARQRRGRSCTPGRRARRRRPAPPSRRRRPRAPSRRSRGRGRPAGVRPAGSMSPSIACRSVAQTPGAPISTTTLLAPVGSGSGRSTSSSGRWYSLRSAALMRRRPRSPPSRRGSRSGRRRGALRAASRAP